MVVILTVDDILQRGLVLIGFNRCQQRNVSRPTNLMRFRAHYGSDPIVYAQIWEDLQTFPGHCADTRQANPDYFLAAVQP